MTDIQTATDIVLKHAKPFGTESIPFQQARNRLLREPLLADRDFPPFNRVTMDGIAIRFADFMEGQRSFPVAGVQPAGSPQAELKTRKQCMEVMTGASLPMGTDTVIRYEDLTIEQGIATLQTDTVKPGQNIHQRGLDRREGDLIVPEGVQITAAEIGVAATVGKKEILVTALPKTVIISTGDELVAVEEEPEKHQIRSSNVHTIKMTLETWGIDAVLMHLPDDPVKTREVLSVCLEEYDLILLSGGVSKGKFDYVPEALEELGVKKLFHKVAQRPGKPFWFGVHEDKTTIFALPGNPVSSFMCTQRYVRPWLRKGLGLEPMDYWYAALEYDYSFKPELTYFLQVSLHRSEDGQLTARPVEGHGSGDLANLVDADAFMELPAKRTVFKAGEVYPVIVYR